MKVFVSALCVFLLITAFVVFNSFAIPGFCGKLLDILGDVDEENFTETSAEFEEKWGECRSYVRFIVGHEDSEKVDDTLDEMKSRYESGDDSGFYSAKAKLTSLIEEIKRAEELSLYALG